MPKEQVKVKRSRKADPIAFRLEESHDDLLVDRMNADPIVGITSKDKFARKCVLDVLLGKAVYLNPMDRLGNPALSGG